MTILKQLLILICCVFILSGCYEDETEITLNANGSGTIKQKLVISERLMVAESEGDGSKNAPPVNKEKILKEVGSAFDITSFTLTDMPDGGRTIEFEGTFSNAEQFFISEFCRKTLKLRLAPVDDGKAAIYCDTSQSSNNSSGPSITQLYGLAKGLYVKRTVHLPAEIEKTNGDYGDDKNTVSWITDLRNKEGLAQTKKFIEGKDKGMGTAIFDASAFKFPLPLKATASTESIDSSKQQKAQDESTELSADVFSVSIKKKFRADDGSTEASDLKIGVEIGWNEGHCPIKFKAPVLLNISDDQNKDLVSDETPLIFPGTIFPNEKTNKRKEIELKAKTPSKNAQKLKHIEGYIPVVMDFQKEKIVLENLQQLVGKEITGNTALDKLHFKIKSTDNSRLGIEIDGGHNTITSIDIYDEDGNKIEYRGGGGSGEDFTYDFANDISKSNKCELEVITSETIVKVPFSLDEIKLP